MRKILVPLHTCERVLEALRRYDERDAAIEALTAEIEGVRTDLLTMLYDTSATDEPLSRDRT